MHYHNTITILCFWIISAAAVADISIKTITATPEMRKGLANFNRTKTETYTSDSYGKKSDDTLSDVTIFQTVNSKEQLISLEVNETLIANKTHCSFRVIIWDTQWHMVNEIFYLREGKLVVFSMSQEFLDSMKRNVTMATIKTCSEGGGLSYGQMWGIAAGVIVFCILSTFCFFERRRSATTVSQPNQTRWWPFWGMRAQYRAAIPTQFEESKYMFQL
jgi:hypothetical protein